jgi:hypothetical protein
MGKFIAVAVCLIAGDLCGAPWRASDQLLYAVRDVESSQGQFTWGDNGRSLGDYQLSEAAWLDVNQWRKARNRTVYEYRQHVLDPTLSRTYAADYLAILHSELRRRIGRPPSHAQLYAAYNMGLSSFAQCRYQLAKVNPTTANRCQRITELASAR